VQPKNIFYVVLVGSQIINQVIVDEALYLLSSVVNKNKNNEFQMLCI